MSLVLLTFFEKFVNDVAVNSHVHDEREPIEVFLRCDVAETAEGDAGKEGNQDDEEVVFRFLVHDIMRFSKSVSYGSKCMSYSVT